VQAEAVTVELYDVMEVNDVRGIYKSIFIASVRILGKCKRSFKKNVKQNNLNHHLCS